LKHFWFNYEGPNIWIVKYRLLAVYVYLFNIITATNHIWRPSTLNSYPENVS